MKAIITASQNRTQSIVSRVSSTVDNVISFSGIPEYYCVGIVDMVNSTNITAKLPYSQACEYYSIFLNTVSAIVKEFGATAVKNIGDSLLYYFPKTSDSNNRHAFIEVLECGMTMVEANSIINEKMLENNLPDLNYRISADYGCVMMADFKTSFNKDIFGSPVNVCTKINPMALPNSMVIGGDMYQYVKDDKGYDFKEIRACIVGHKHQYPVYSVKRSSP